MKFVDTCLYIVAACTALLLIVVTATAIFKGTQALLGVCS